MQVLDLDSNKLVNIDLDMNAISNYTNNYRNKCVLYTPCSYYEVIDEGNNIIIGINNYTRNIESFSVEQAGDLFYNIKNTEDIYTCRIKNIIPDIKFRFNLRASVSKFMFSYENGSLKPVQSNLPIINRLRSTVKRNNRIPRKLLMWEFIRIDELAENKVIKVNFVANKVEDIREDEVAELIKIRGIGEGSEKFKNHILKLSGGMISDGQEDMINEFDFVTTSKSDLDIRSKIYRGEYVIVKENILCNNVIAMGKKSKKCASAIFINKFISRKLMVFKHSGIIPCLSIVDFRDMFGFYPIWYLHPDVSIYGSDTMSGLLDLVDLVDSENTYDSEDEVKDVWKYFVPYYMADDWESYLVLVAEEKAKLSGLDKVGSIDLVDEKDFIEYMLINRFTNKPKQLTNILNGIGYNNQIHFEPGKIPKEYDLAVKGYRCNFYIFEDGELFLRDCVALKTIKINELGNSERDIFFRKICNLVIKYDLVFKRISPVLFILVKNGYVLKMSQIGTLYIDIYDGHISLDIPRVITDDFFTRIQTKRHDCHTKMDEDYKRYYGKEGLPDLVERAMYRSEGLDGFLIETDKQIEIFGSRRQPIFDDNYKYGNVFKWRDIRDVYNFYYGSNIMQWLRMGARGESSHSAFLDEPDWDRVVWYCNFNTWFASVEMSLTSEDGNGKDDLKVILNNRYNPEYFYYGLEFYNWGGVCLVKGKIPERNWRLCVDCYPMQYFDLSNLSKTSIIESKVYNDNEGRGIFCLALNSSDIIFRSKKYIIVESDGHRYLIGDQNEFGVYVVENALISALTVEVIKNIERSEDETYVNGVWKYMHLSDFTEIEVISDKLYLVRQKKLKYGNKVTDDEIIKGNGTYIEFYVFIDKIIYPFKCDKLDTVRVEERLKVNEEEYEWSFKNSLFVRKVCEQEIGNIKLVNDSNLEQKSNIKLESTSLFDKTSSENIDDWLYDFDTDFGN